MGQGVGLWSLLIGGDWVASGILLILAGMSVGSWAVILIKWIQFRQVRGENEFFQDIFARKPTHREISDSAKRLRISPLARMYEGSYREVISYRTDIEKSAGSAKAGQDKLQIAVYFRERLLERLLRTQDKNYNAQSVTLERRLPMLATVSGAAPFIGLFGTVLGIIDAFRSIGMSGVTSLAVVAPGISEALVATAAGLFAAIPALVAYNVFRNTIRETSTELKNFALEITNRLDKIF